MDHFDRDLMFALGVVTERHYNRLPLTSTIACELGIEAALTVLCAQNRIEMVDDEYWLTLRSRGLRTRRNSRWNLFFRPSHDVVNARTKKVVVNDYA